MGNTKIISEHVKEFSRDFLVLCVGIDSNATEYEKARPILFIDIIYRYYLSILFIDLFINIIYQYYLSIYRYHQRKKRSRAGFSFTSYNALSNLYLKANDVFDNNVDLSTKIGTKRNIHNYTTQKWKMRCYYVKKYGGTKILS